jgi:hypothetical protein
MVTGAASTTAPRYVVTTESIVADAAESLADVGELPHPVNTLMSVMTAMATCVRLGMIALRESPRRGRQRRRVSHFAAPRNAVDPGSSVQTKGGDSRRNHRP